MNVIPYLNYKNNRVVYCIVDKTHEYSDNYTRELMKNIADFTISNIFSKGYDIYVGLDEDTLLQSVCDKYEHAVVFSTGTEFINGRNFFNEIDKLTNTDYCLYGHILDRKEAYYELHHQCYLLNLHKYLLMNCPVIGKQQLGSTHSQMKPNRSTENIHDNYTPLSVTVGTSGESYQHKMHGYNLISTVLENSYPIYAFDDSIRNNKKYYYPENQREFMRHVSWAHARYNYCANNFVHHSHTEDMNVPNDYEQIITPASTDYFVDYPGKVILYDYNLRALEYYSNIYPETTEFVHIDLLGEYNINDLVKYPDKKTLLNVSNIFNYEGTSMFCSLKYRLYKENMLISQLPDHWDLLISQESNLGFGNSKDITKLIKPTWHMNSDWNE